MIKYQQGDVIIRKLEQPIKEQSEDYNGNQVNLWNNRTDGARVNGWGHHWGTAIDQDEVEYNQEYEKMENAQALFDEGKMTKKKYNKAKKEWVKFEKDHFGIL